MSADKLQADRTPPKPPRECRPPELFQIVVQCASEEEQRELYERRVPLLARPAVGSASAANVHSWLIDVRSPKALLGKPAVAPEMSADKLQADRTPPNPPREGRPPELFQIVIECSSEDQQRELFERFRREGLKLRLLVL